MKLQLTSLALLLLGAPPEALGEEAAAPPTPPEVVEEAPAPSLAEVVGGAGEVEARVRQIEADLAPDAELAAMAIEVAEHLEVIAERTDAAREQIEAATQLRELSSIETRWLPEQEALEAWRDTTTERAKAIDEGLATTDELIRVWEETRAEAKKLRAPTEVIDQIGRTLAVARESQKKITAYRSEVLTLQAELAGGLATVSDILERARRGQESIRVGLFGADSLPVWTALQQPGNLEKSLDDALAAIERDLVDLRIFVRRHTADLTLHLGILVILVALLLGLRRSAAGWVSEEERAESWAQVLGRPYAAATLIAILAGPVLYPKAPTYFSSVFLLIALVSTFRLIPPLLERGARPAFYALAAFFVLDLVRDALAGIPGLARLVFEVELTAAAATLVWLLHPRRMALLPRARVLMPVFVLVRRVAFFLVVLALAGSALGYVALSRLIGEGVLRSAYIGVIFYAGYKVLSGLISILPRARVLQRLNLIRLHRPAITSRLTTFAAFAFLLAWILYALRFFSIRDPLIEALTTALSTSLSVGELEISLGGIVAFVATLAITIYLARFVRYVLDEDVTPRLSLQRGVPNAISTSAFYIVLVFGVLSAFAAAGLDLSRFALLAGALGVGIGFGLGDLVNNFLSGLILLFERPIKPGDTIEIGTLVGEVRRIRIRTTSVRTWEGAEVIVPNARLVSDQVINWTLSDRQRRIDVDVGVKYGTDPERVLELLLGVARAHDRILDVPEPSALFLEFGDSALGFRLRAWTVHFDQWVTIRSDLTVAINTALKEARIEIPFPQRDLHLRSVSEEARNALLDPDPPTHPIGPKTAGSR